MVLEVKTDEVNPQNLLFFFVSGKKKMKFGKAGYRGLRLHSAISDACVVCNRVILDYELSTSCTLKDIAENSGDSWIWRSCLQRLTLFS